MNRLRSWVTSLRSRGVRLAMAATLAASGVAFVATSSPAYATQYCALSGTECINAWNGGPEVRVQGPGAANNNFTVLNLGGYNQIQFLGISGHSGDCVGDLNNDPNNARAGLVSCSHPTDWGVNFDELPGCSGIIFNNVHWSAFLGPQNTTNGSPFYLNKPSGWCFTVK